MKFSINIILSLFIVIFISACSSGSGGGSSGDPGIINFSAAETTIALGSSVELNVEFVGGTGVINNGVGEVTSGTTVSVSPDTTTTYNLTVTNNSGSISITSIVTITVVPGIIESFSAVSPIIKLGDSTDLTAIFTTDGTAIIDNGVGSITSGASKSITPTETTDYTLTLTNSLGETVSLTITVTVVALDSLSIVDHALTQKIFQPSQPDYAASVGFLAKSIRVKATSPDTSLTIKINGTTIGADNLSQSIDLAVGATAITVVVSKDTISKTYNLTVTRETDANFAEQSYIKASNTGDRDEFGYSVAVSGDTLVVGAWSEDSGSDITPDDAATDSGAVYVFTRSGGIWSQQAYLKASNISPSDGFGYSVALSGDTLAVGAIGEQSSSTGINSTPDDALTNAGAVYVFTRIGTSWSQQAYIKASNTGDQDEFGISVSLYEDTLAVGAHKEDSETTGINSTPVDTIDGSNSGAVYVFTRSGTSWSQQAYIKASNTGALDTFGENISLFGDTLAVGAINEDSETTGINSTPVDNSINDNFGAVYVFARDNNSWQQQAYIKAAEILSAGGGSKDFFGSSVSLYADTLAVGMTGEDSDTTGIDTTPTNSAGGRDSGAVYVYSRSGSTWSKQAYIKASTVNSNDQFGISVSLSGDTLAVGAHVEDSDTAGIDSTPNTAGSNSGAVYVFTRDVSTWSELHYIKASNAGNGDLFGHSTALAGDTLAVGAHSEESSTTGIGSTPNDDINNAGAVYTFE